MKSEPLSRALTSANSFDERLRDVFSWHAATEVLDEYLSSVRIDEDNPAFLFDWQVDNVIAFVAAANNLNAAQAPPWLRTLPPNITAGSFVDDVMITLQPLAGDRCGHLMLAPNTLQQYGRIVSELLALQNDEFLQNAAQVALPVVNGNEPRLAITHHLADTRVHRAQANNLRPNRRNGQPLRQLFI
ncbi:hypothetical protein PR003_g3072 [Phytophthora rubi]|uniref:Uncharacterized protein n=1 Tax=Phytophthora rubi TaxID=129364 RepID=A0A6A3NLH7_9STRA|nr:hypothetical protein PR002_g15347 [Phytophthora rubi]KAE9046204.1 hypothetical protein PR001_g4663 [Phytophthora rubi]KAE9354991.1 hypothetical protein PR003_g3072 [Phytophthora rubi]